MAKAPARPISWERTKSCGNRNAYWGVSSGCVFAVISQDAGGWYVWLPGEKKSLGIFEGLQTAKAHVEAAFPTFRQKRLKNASFPTAK